MSYRVEFSPSIKQDLAWKLLTDSITTHVGYGGAARSGKSYLMCYWFVWMAMQYPGTKWGLARKQLTVLRKTTLVTLFKVLVESGMVVNNHYKYNAADHIITFINGSQIILIDTAWQPSDPLYTRYGGLELTGCGIDESNESPYMAVEILFTRCGWCQNEKYGIKKKMLETFNPDKGHVYSRYWMPYKENKELENRKFIPALPSDNPDPAITEWIKDVKANSDEVTIQRLIYGNFDYDDDDSILCSYDAIQDCFTNTFVEAGEKYLTADVALEGRDLFVTALWSGLRVMFPIVKQKSTAKGVEKDIRSLAETGKVPRSHTIVDSVGVGSYLPSYVPGIKAFKSGNAPIDKQYKNLRAQCLYELANKINRRELYIMTDSQSQRDRISIELNAIRIKNMGKDEQTKQIIPKDEIKEIIGYSPDYMDVLKMRMLPEIKPGARQLHASELYANSN